MNKNVTSLGFYQSAQLMYSGGEDCMARIWDLRWVWHKNSHSGWVWHIVHIVGVTSMQSVFFPLLSFTRSHNQQCQRLFQVNAAINCMCLHPNQATLIVGDQSGTVHVWDLSTDFNEQLVTIPIIVIIIVMNSY